MSEEQERLRRFTVYLEEDQIEALSEVVKEMRAVLGKRWSKGAVIRLALSEFLTKQGRIA